MPSQNHTQVKVYHVRELTPEQINALGAVMGSVDSHQRSFFGKDIAQGLALTDIMKIAESRGYDGIVVHSMDSRYAIARAYADCRADLYKSGKIVH